VRHPMWGSLGPVRGGGGFQRTDCLWMKKAKHQKRVVNAQKVGLESIPWRFRHPLPVGALDALKVFRLSFVVDLFDGTFKDDQWIPHKYVRNVL